MKERPILFSAPMVRALLAGAKTQTRRALSTQPTGTPHAAQASLTKSGSRPVFYAAWEHPGADESTCCICPYGVPGDQLWCREAHAFSVVDPEGRHWNDDPENWDVIYRADEHQPAGGWRDTNSGKVIAPPWRPSIHMPRWASRILLEVTDVRVERLQDISEADALAEGIEHLPRLEGYGLPDGSHYHGTDPRISYWSLWEFINGAGSVGANPWVWCVSFRRITP